MLALEHGAHALVRQPELVRYLGLRDARLKRSLHRLYPLLPDFLSLCFPLPQPLPVVLDGGL